MFQALSAQKVLAGIWSWSYEDGRSDACGRGESKLRTGAIRLRGVLPSAQDLTPYNILTIKDASILQASFFATSDLSSTQSNPRTLDHTVLFVVFLKIARKLPSLPQLSSSVPLSLETGLSMVRMLSQEIRCRTVGIEYANTLC